MQDEQRDKVVSLIYDAALDGTRWPDALVAIAEATRTGQSVLHIIDRNTGLSTRVSPLTDPDCARTFRANWGPKPNLLWRRTDRFPLGRPFTIEDTIGRDGFSKLPEYHEWWRPQGMGLASLGANLAIGHDAMTILSVYKNHWEDGFAADEQRMFRLCAQHLIKAIEVHRRLGLAAVHPAADDASPTPNGFAIIDRKGRILLAGEATETKLAAACLLVSDGRTKRMRSPDRALERLLADASARSTPAGPRGGSFDHFAPDGQLLRITVIPCHERDPADAQWLAIDRPAALIHVSDPTDRARARIDRLIAARGLTPGEAAVAVEIARGDGRAATAARLGIRETTVRSHLTTIFDKLDIHRQAELTRIVAEA